MMKIFFKFSCCAALCVLAFSSCTRHSTASTIPLPRTTSGHYLNASSGTIGSFSSSGTAVTTNGAAGAKIVIEGNSTTGSNFLVIMNPYPGTTGTFIVSDTSSTNCQYASITTIINGVHGTVTLTSVTPDIIGTFTFTGRDSSIFTGSFNAPMP